MMGNWGLTVWHYNYILLSKWWFDSQECKQGTNVFVRLFLIEGLFWVYLCGSYDKRLSVAIDVTCSGGSRISPRRGANSSGGGRGAPTYDFAKCSQKLHEIEIIWTPRGRASLAPPLDPPMTLFMVLVVTVTTPLVRNNLWKTLLIIQYLQESAHLI